MPGPLDQLAGSHGWIDESTEMFFSNRICRSVIAVTVLLMLAMFIFFAADWPMAPSTAVRAKPFEPLRTS